MNSSSEKNLPDNNKNNSITFLVFRTFMCLILVLSICLNSWSVYLIHKIRKKISADYIKSQLFFVNILFTLIAVPYYLLRETKQLKSEFFCKFLYSITDFIMFVYNNLLILMAIDRFLFICTNIRIKLKRFFRIFYIITILISSTSFARFLMNNCYEIILKSFVPDCSRFAEHESTNFCFREHVIYFYNYFILLVIGINWSLTSILYLLLIRYVYKKTLIGKSYNFYSHSGKNKRLELKILNQQNMPKIRNKIFRSSKHWEITKTFIKVRSNF